MFVGEPLARPWRGAVITWEDPKLIITTYQLVPGVTYQLESSDSADGPWTPLGDLQIPQSKRTEITINDATAAFYRVIVKP